MKTNFTQSLRIFLFFLLANSFFLTAQVSVESGSYTNTFPGTDSAGRNGFPSGSPQVSGNAVGKPVPTNDWWSKLIKENHADNLFNYPMTLKTTNQGLIVTYIPWGPIGDSAPIEVGLTGLNASMATASDYSDWTVTMNWNDGTHELQATSGIGMPFLYFEKDNDAVVEIKVNSGTPTISNEILIVTDATNGADFVIYAPTGSTWNQSGNLYTSTLNGNDYWSMAMLPQSTTNVSTVAEAYKNYAYVFPTNTTSSWSYNESNSKLTTTFSVDTEVKEGTNTHMLLGLLPHQWNNLAPGSPTPDEYSYDSVRGELKTLDGNSFTVENTFKGILPTLPDLAHYSPDFNPADLDTKIASIENDQLATWTDSYNEGQVMNRLIQTARIADQTGDFVARDKMVATIKERLEDWLTYQAGEVAFLFYYNDTWSSMLGYPAGHGQDNNINDHHFHWGYFIHAAAFMEQFEPGWVNEWGAMINLLVRDAATDDRNDALFPFLRNFSPYAGHSWANGFATFPQGNDQESTSESMQFASSLIHWGTITENNAIRDLGIYIYTTEQTAIEEYWFDMYERNFQPSQQYSLVSRVWGNSYDNGTFWTSDIAASYGIEMYPIHGGSFYLGHNQAYAQSLWTEITANTGVLSNEDNPNLWHDTYWKYLSLIDAPAALDLYNSYPDRNLKFGISDAQTYHWLHTMNVLGPVDASITADYPIAVAFSNDGEMTYVAHNYSDAPITVNFSDGFMLEVPANSMATNRDLNVSGILSADTYQANENDPVMLSTETSGSGITKVEFYMGDTLLGQDTTAPYEWTIPTIALGIHHLYAKIYVGTDFKVSNLITIQVGEQLPYLGTPHLIPGTIEAGTYDSFEGGNGQNISYYDSTLDNQGGFRPNEYVDAVEETNEGATVGWISSGEWMEYTVDVQTTGCYDLDLRYASGNSNGGGPFYFEIDGEQVSPAIGVATTGDWGNWNTKVTTIDLTAGIHVLRLTATNGEFNLGRMTFTYNSLECAPTAGIGLPFDFETTPVTSDFFNFNGGTATVEPVTAPQNMGNNSTHLAKLVRDGGDVWAGAYLNLEGGLDFTNDRYITLKLWTSAPVNTTVRLKLEQQSNAGSFSELDVLTQKSGEWETLTWDFSSLGATVYDKMVFMFDYGNTGDGTASSTFYFDDVQQVATLGTEGFDLDTIQIFPNPTTGSLHLTSNSIQLLKVELFSLLGNRLMVLDAKNLHTIDVSNLANGLYLIKIHSAQGAITKKFIKK
ncbi:MULTISPECIES: glycosyl hydrolase [Mesonia]|uniref:Exo-beta-D-glucosaminidase n=1 Tax=Mesonia oceanica TaxID=2687242 RepID=A0AC61Y4T4_9FLAO|nr:MULTISPECIES: glycosyl hydrolase [Mesonia]MAN26592.1 endo-1,3(4)-beta-glucanase [Mesonia sp.]MAQ40860.1 endo-1,3(4)-beta-glucanase [Mesonia sp.]MBJ97781.1 endo-1,3(4)-beta-glucanase [Flavobacteriaceae bacterium]VVU99489.1 Exo-beta-D-glucosaminidase [Mesonia oceanica]|tara:strand:+ start:2127 stop:5861 length:3735 start_codon:yes stop_codon:yes gene_type:complete